MLFTIQGNKKQENGKKNAVRCHVGPLMYGSLFSVMGYVFYFECFTPSFMEMVTVRTMGDSTVLSSG